MSGFRKVVFVICLASFVCIIAEYYVIAPAWDKWTEIQPNGNLSERVFVDVATSITPHTDRAFSPLTIGSPISESDVEIGTVNYDVWRWMSGYLVDDMRLWWNFPKYPEERKMLSSLVVSYYESVEESNFRGKYAHKVYGYLLPPKSGLYKFQIVMTKVTCGCEVELWVSCSTDPMEMKIIASLMHVYASVSEEILTTLSESIKLSSNTSYYFEFLQKAFDGGVAVEIKWKHEDSEEFVQISNSSIARTTSLANKIKELGTELPSSKLQRCSRVQPIANAFRSVTNVDVLPSCEFNAKYAFKHYVPKYAGINEVVHSKVYPFDGSNVPDNYNGETPTIDQHLAEQVIELYGKELRQKHPNATYKLIRMEETQNEDLGSRFLLEMEINFAAQDNAVYSTQYVYLPANSGQLCATLNFKWNPDAQVYLVVATKNSGSWVHQLLYNVEQIYAVTKDEKFELIIVDFESNDINLTEVVHSSSFKRCHLIQLQGKFSRAGGLQSALKYISDPNSIVMTMDLHLYIPVDFIHSIRKHVVQGKMSYAPVLVRLGKGFSETNIHGFWELAGYGIYAMYKSDWEAIGGFNTDEYTFNWGGEDWDIVDKVAAYGVETFRMRYPGFVHYFHTLSGLWDNPKS